MKAIIQTPHGEETYECMDGYYIDWDVTVTGALKIYDCADCCARTMRTYAAGEWLTIEKVFDK
jgi:hypothetical protein